jgi:hypothetical protein
MKNFSVNLLRISKLALALAIALKMSISVLYADTRPHTYRQKGARPVASKKQERAGKVERDDREPAYYLQARGLNSIQVTDASGNSNAPLAGSVFGAKLADVTYQLGLNSISIITPTTQSYTLTFRSTGQPIFLEVVKGTGNQAPTQAVRYLDLNLPVGVMAMFKLTPEGVEDLRYDKDGDGRFEKVVTPTASVVGAAALDISPPVITFKQRTQGARKLVTIITRDKGAGVKAVHYSFDGANFQLYTDPLLIDPARTKTIYAFADDNVANRSGTVVYKVSARR